MAIKKTRTFMITPRLWNRFKRQARDKHDQTASARLRDIIEKDLESNDKPDKPVSG
jgi:hypothetical protein